METKIYFISDLHFFHRAIIWYCNRPFSDTDEMAQTIIKNWNKVVKKNYSDEDQYTLTQRGEKNEKDNNVDCGSYLLSKAAL